MYVYVYFQAAFLATIIQNWLPLSCLLYLIDWLCFCPMWMYPFLSCYFRESQAYSFLYQSCVLRMGCKLGSRLLAQYRHKSPYREIAMWGAALPCRMTCLLERLLLQGSDKQIAARLQSSAYIANLSERYIIITFPSLRGRGREKEIEREIKRKRDVILYHLIYVCVCVCKVSRCPSPFTPEGGRHLYF